MSGEVTPLLDDFLREYEADDNVWWGMGCGHHQNLFEAAVERMETAEKLLKCLIIPESVLNATPPSRHNYRGDDHPITECSSDRCNMPPAYAGQLASQVRELGGQCPCGRVIGPRCSEQFTPRNCPRKETT